MISLLVALYFPQLRIVLNLKHLNNQYLMSLTCLQRALTQYLSPKPFQIFCLFPLQHLTQSENRLNSLWRFSLIFQALGNPTESGLPSPYPGPKTHINSPGPSTPVPTSASLTHQGDPALILTLRSLGLKLPHLLLPLILAVLFPG